MKKIIFGPMVTFSFNLMADCDAKRIKSKQDRIRETVRCEINKQRYKDCP